MKYTFCQFYDHRDQALQDAMKWHETLRHFKDDHERAAYKAGFDQGAFNALRLLKLHADFSLTDPKR